MVEVSPYNPLWPKQFDEEAEHIRKALGDNCIAVHHVGSTAVVGLYAKPKIDIITVVKDRDNCISQLEGIGYQYKGEYNIPFKLGFSKRTEISVNLHVYEDGNPEIELNLLFRDYLRSSKEARLEYNDLKMNLLKEKSSHEKNNAMFRGYTLGKNAFIRKILEASGFNGICFRFCVHHEEWDKAKEFRQKYFFDKANIVDPYTWTFKHPEHIHFVLYQGCNIIGYAHIERWPEERAMLRIIVIDEPYRNQGLGSQFLSLCERWLKLHHFRLLQTEASPAAKQFYVKLDYVEMPTNDPTGEMTHPNDTPMGKIL